MNWQYGTRLTRMMLFSIFVSAAIVTGCLVAASYIADNPTFFYAISISYTILMPIVFTAGVVKNVQGKAIGTKVKMSLTISAPSIAYFTAWLGLLSLSWLFLSQSVNSGLLSMVLTGLFFAGTMCIWSLYIPMENWLGSKIDNAVALDEQNT